MVTDLSSCTTFLFDKEIFHMIDEIIDNKTIENK